MKIVKQTIKLLTLTLLGVSLNSVGRQKESADLQKRRQEIAERKERLAKRRKEKEAKLWRKVAGGSGPGAGAKIILPDEKELQKLDKEDRYTQTESYFKIPWMTKIFDKAYPGHREKYADIWKELLAKEQQFKNTHFAFYHALDNVWMTVQSLYKALLKRLFAEEKKFEHFEFLRWGLKDKYKSAQEFLLEQLQNHGMVNDNKDEIKLLILSVNFISPGGNPKTKGESTWSYFVEPKSHFLPAAWQYEMILDQFGIDHKYIPEIMALNDIIKTEEQTLLQIFVPINIVDQVAYLSFRHGIPYDYDLIKLFKDEYLKEKTEDKTFYETFVAVQDKITTMFKEQKEKNPQYKELIDGVQKGKYSLRKLIHQYRNNPVKIKKVIELQARLLFTPDLLLNPYSGIKFFRYSTRTPEQIKEFQSKLNDIVDRAVKERLDQLKQELRKEQKERRVKHKSRKSLKKRN